jgi:predicted phage baseplate assembly protein
MSCACDIHICPSPFSIPAGLLVLPRAPGMFPDWRENLLFAVGREPPLADWRAREPGDLGLMLVEMGAYVLDVTSFYDQLVANESYLSTARLTGTQRRLVSLLGYLPRPAIGACVWLVAEADGVRLITLPAGTAIRSGAFDGNPPQLFELGTTAQIEPRINRLDVNRVPAAMLPASFSSIQVRQGSVRARAGDLVVFDANGVLFATHVAGPRALMLRFRDPVSELRFTTTIAPPAGSTYADARLLKAGLTCGAWKLAPASGEPAVLSGAELSLDSRLPNLHAGDIVAITDGTTAVASRITAATDVQYTLLAPLTSTITDSANKVSTLLSPAIKVSITRLTLDTVLPFSATAVPQLVVHHTMVDAATLNPPLKDTLDQGDPIIVPGLIDPPRTVVTELMLEDAHGEGVATTGTLDPSSRSGTTSTAPAWGQSLMMPVQLFGNVMQATRGESVHGELLGVGNASAPFQTFRLKKKPLTYLAAANSAGRTSSLVIHVGGVAWEEVENFFGVPSDTHVYIVRHDDDGNTDVTFGGGARLPTNAAVVADYRFGAGAAAPPADSVKQVAKPIAGLRKIHNILPAFGGSDAEGPAELAVRGPASALLLGRAISLPDMETAAAQQPGVRAAKATWNWDALGLRPAVIVTYIGDPQLAPSIQAVLRALAEDDAPITAQSAVAQPARLDVDIAIDARYVPDDVIAAVSQALFAPVTLPGTGGLLQPERLGPEGILYESIVVRAVVDVPGVSSLRGLAMDGTPFTDIGRKPSAGSYFDFAAGGVWVNGKRAG